MRRRLLWAGVALGVGTLSVSLVVSGLPAIIFGSATSTPAIAAAASVTDDTTQSTSTDKIVVAFAQSGGDPAAKARAAVRRAVAALGAKIVQVKALDASSAAVTVDKQLTRSQAKAVAASVQKQSGVKYAEGSMTLYPTGVTPTAASYQWNLTGNSGVNATSAWNTATGTGVKVGVIDTGIADNAQLPKSLTLYPTDGKTITGTTWPGLAVTVTDGSGTVCTATALDDGDFNCTPATARTHRDELTATIGDAAKTSTTVTVDASLDSLAVDPYFTSSTISGTAELGATVTVTDLAGGTICTTSATNTDTSSLTGSFTCTVSADGTYTVTAEDALGNTASTTTVVDTAKPDAPVIVSPSDGATLSDAKPTVSGTGESGATVTVFDADGQSACSAAVTDGSWSCAPSAAVADGTYTVHATQTDQAGNTSEASSAITVTVDTTTPGAVVISTPADNAVLNDATPTVSGTGEAAATVTVTEPAASGSSQAVCSSTVLADGSWSCTPTSDVGEGTHTVAVTQTDKAKHTSTAATVVFTIDTVAPDAPSVTTSTEALVAGTAEANSTVTISYFAADSTTASQTATAAADGSWSATLSPVAAVDSTVSVTATDAAKNVSAVTTAVVVATASATPTASATATASVTSDPTETATSDPSATATASTTSDPTETATSDPSATATASASETETAATTSSSSAEVQPANTSTSATSVTSHIDTVTSKTSTVGTVLPGYDFVSNDANAEDPVNGSISEDAPAGTTGATSHGTHVAGIVAANTNSTTFDKSTGYPVGVAPNAEVVPIRAITADGGDMTDVANAIKWAAGESVAGTTITDPVDVINLSLGGTGSCSTTLQDAINDATNNGIPVVVSAGNNNSSIANYAPANCKNVIVVTATTNTGAKATYSNWGGTTTSSTLVAAPGGDGICAAIGDCIVSTTNTFSYTDTNRKLVSGQTLIAMAGTSQAAPHVTGTIALMKQKNSKLTRAQIADILSGSANSLSDGCATTVCGVGIVNAATALANTPSSDGVVAVVPATTTYPTAIRFTTNLPSTSKVGTTVGIAATSGYPALSYQWYRRNNTAIGGATNTWYTLTAADAGYVYAKAYPTGEDPSVSTAVTTTVMKVNPGTIWVRKSPSISGTKRVGKTLKSTRGTWSVAVGVKYQWLRNGKTIKKATKSSYKLTRADRGKRISVRVTATSSGYATRTVSSAKTSTIRR